MNKVIYQYSIPLFFILFALFSFQKEKNKDVNIKLEKTILKVVKAFEEEDATTLNSLILKDKGLIVLYRPGTMNNYKKTNIIDFKNPIPNYLPYEGFKTDYKVTFTSLPLYDCGTDNWNKNGLFCDTTQRDHLFSETAKSLKKYAEKDISELEIKSFEQLENNSRRIILCDNDKGEIIFYLSLINSKWYLTILDRVTCDCSA